MDLRRFHKRDQSPLFRIAGPRRLCRVLQVTDAGLEKLLSAADSYLEWEQHQGKKSRSIQKPKPALDRVHKRVANLLARIEVPSYVHSSVKGRSYLTNAAEHTADVDCIKTDVKSFFASSRATAVYRFFLQRMECAPHVSGMLTKLLTVDGHLATGSSVSPILSYFAYEDMFAELHALAENNACTMTCYVDDIVFTGPTAKRSLQLDASKIIASYQLKAHKKRWFQAGQPRIITGIAVTTTGPRLPNKRKDRIRQDISALKAMSRDEQLALLPKLIGRLYEAAMIDPHKWYAEARKYSQHFADLRR